MMTKVNDGPHAVSVIEVVMGMIQKNAQVGGEVKRGTNWVVS